MWVLSSFSFFLSLPPHLTTCKIWSVKKNRSSFMPLTHACHPQDSSLSYILHGLRESSVFDLHLGTSFCKPRWSACRVELQYTLGGSRSGNHSQMFNWNVFLIESMKRMYTWKVPGGVDLWHRLSFESPVQSSPVATSVLPGWSPFPFLRHSINNRGWVGTWWSSVGQENADKLESWTLEVRGFWLWILEA